MKEYYSVISDITVTFEVLAFLLMLFIYKHSGITLSFVHKSSLKTPQDHQIYSCFICAFLGPIFSLLGNQLAYDLIALSMEVIDRRQVFYVALMCHIFFFMLTAYIFHRLRGCRFSLIARICMYLMWLMTMNYAQLVLRGYFDVNFLYEYDVYGVFIVFSNAVIAIILLSYSIRYVFVNIYNKSQ
ncbi:hypothetical protein PSECIP111854_02595 [Pseudoalteromonas sp. CIP111854]|uniref:Uncharacterized protein n=1 Tax=Pseudoalteromonas holothuriae TaxID=2963714 RepID=A0A9W4QZV4_9GAMM|nr:hypothetical protein [Pseudoalteromonas sp. CIP111854]CAH9060387.1 hypothetical protein PSECIP111854_02595 [Pseudoalteromonas sp. CIP111854]